MSKQKFLDQYGQKIGLMLWEMWEINQDVEKINHVLERLELEKLSA
jgi:hypothetical protein